MKVFPVVKESLPHVVTESSMKVRNVMMETRPGLMDALTGAGSGRIGAVLKTEPDSQSVPRSQTPAETDSEMRTSEKNVMTETRSTMTVVNPHALRERTGTVKKMREVCPLASRSRCLVVMESMTSRLRDVMTETEKTETVATETARNRTNGPVPLTKLASLSAP